MKQKICTVLATISLAGFAISILITLGHSLWYSFHHVDLTHMQMLLDPENFAIPKLLTVFGFYLSWVVFSKLAAKGW